MLVFRSVPVPVNVVLLREALVVLKVRRATQLERIEARRSDNPFAYEIIDFFLG